MALADGALEAMALGDDAADVPGVVAGIVVEDGPADAGGEGVTAVALQDASTRVATTATIVRRSTELARMRPSRRAGARGRARPVGGVTAPRSAST